MTACTKQKKQTGLLQRKLYLPVIWYRDRVVFSNERKVEIGANKRAYIWRKAREEWKPECTDTPPRKKFEIMVWGCIS